MLNIDTPFWRNEPFTDEDRTILKALFLAHHASTLRNNPSTANVANTALGSGSLSNSIASAILSVGTRHAPVVETFRLLSSENAPDQVRQMIGLGIKVPGWGGAFQKDAPDPIWEPVNRLIGQFDPVTAIRIDEVTNVFLERGKSIFPNPSAFTAAIAIFIRMPAELSPFLFIAGRLSGWASIATQYLK